MHTVSFTKVVPQRPRYFVCGQRHWRRSSDGSPVGPIFFYGKYRLRAIMTMLAMLATARYDCSMLLA